jgi:hypothetical protein
MPPKSPLQSLTTLTVVISATPSPSESSIPATNVTV